MESCEIGNWIVTEESIVWNKKKRGDYSIPIKQILQKGVAERAGMYDWLIHVPLKTWLDVDDVLSLNEAFLYAAKKNNLTVDVEKYNNTISYQLAIIQKKRKSDK